MYARGFVKFVISTELRNKNKIDTFLKVFDNVKTDLENNQAIVMGV